MTSRKCVDWGAACSEQAAPLHQIASSAESLYANSGWSVEDHSILNHCARRARHAVPLRSWVDLGASRNVFESGMQRLEVVFYTIVPVLPMNFR